MLLWGYLVGIVPTLGPPTVSLRGGIQDGGLGLREQHHEDAERGARAPVRRVG